MHMKRATGKTAVLCGIGLAVGAAFAVPPEVTNVTLVQPQDTRVAVVAFQTDGAGIATFQMKTNGVDISHSEIVRTVSGDINKWLSSAGTYTFSWDAGRDYPERVMSNLTCEVTLWATNAPPLYCAVTLVEDGNGRYPLRWYGKEGEVPFGVTNSYWKKDCLLLRRIDASEGLVTLGSPPTEWGRDGSETLRQVRITQPFYLGVFEVTQRQWANVRNMKPSRWNNATDWEERPVETISYNSLRGSTTDSPAVDWPTTGHAVVASGSFMGVMRSKTGGLLEFDLPTDAQWEYACRAGTSGPWNNGGPSASNDIDPNLALLGRYGHNGGKNTSGGGWADWPDNCFASNATAKIGAYLPNAWGLYDMHGNVGEWCLDWYEANVAALQQESDPVGPASGSNRIRRGGNSGDTAGLCRSARRSSPGAPGSSFGSTGFRVAAPAEVLMHQ